MAIQTVGIGAAPNDNTGDTPRTGIAKLNANFTDTANAASRLVQTSPTDATEGRVMTVGAGGLLTELPSITTGGYQTLIDDKKTVFQRVFDNAVLAGTRYVINFIDSAGNGIQLAPRSSGVDFDWQGVIAGVGQGWQPVYTGANYQPDIIGGIGTVQIMKNVSGGAINRNISVSGTNLNFTIVNTSGVIVGTTATSVPVGSIWKQVAGANLAANESGLFARLS